MKALTYLNPLCSRLRNRNQQLQYTTVSNPNHGSESKIWSPDNFRPSWGFAIYLIGIMLVLASCKNDIFTPEIPNGEDTGLRATPPPLQDKKEVHNARGLSADGSGVAVILADNGGIDLSHPEFSETSLIDVARLSPTNHSMINGNILVGKGTFPETEGMAPRSTLITGYQSKVLDDINQLAGVIPGLSIAVHPYASPGDPYLGDYTPLSRYTDTRASEKPGILHVWGGGNKVEPVHQYATAKNVLTVGKCLYREDLGQVCRDGGSYGTRSRAFKPEIMALSFHRGARPDGEYGTGGGSGHSAAVVGGAAALVQQALRKGSEMEVFNSALVKNILCNGADLMGSPSEPYPRRADQRWGFGSLNVARSVEIAESGNWTAYLVQKGKSLTTSLKKLGEVSGTYKVMITWLDPADETGSAVTFTNKIILRVNGKEAGPFANIQQVAGVSVNDPIQIEIFDESGGDSQLVFLTWTLLSGDELIGR